MQYANTTSLLPLFPTLSVDKNRVKTPPILSFQRFARK
jgi:hypothetical protein